MRAKLTLLLLLPLVLVSCLASPTETAETTLSEEPATPAQVTAEYNEAATEQATAEVTEIVQAEDHCLDCHTDQERLIQTANAVEEEPDESSGVG